MVWDPVVKKYKMNTNTKLWPKQLYDLLTLKGKNQRLYSMIMFTIISPASITTKYGYCGKYSYAIFPSQQC